MPYYSPEELRAKFIGPAMQLTSDLNKLATELENAQKSGLIGPEGVLLTAQSALKGIIALRTLKRRVADKIEAAQDGTLESRERDRLRKRKERSRTASRK